MCAGVQAHPAGLERLALAGGELGGGGAVQRGVEEESVGGNRGAGSQDESEDRFQCSTL